MAVLTALGLASDRWACRTSQVPSYVVCLVACGMLMGCGEGEQQGVIIEGKVVQGGVPLEVPNREVGLGNVEVRLVPASPETEGADAEGDLSDLAKEDGSFTILGRGRGVPPGKYRLAVYQQDQGYGSDMLEGRFSDERSPIEVEVPAGNLGGKHNLGVIDLEDWPG